MTRVSAQFAHSAAGPGDRIRRRQVSRYALIFSTLLLSGCFRSVPEPITTDGLTQVELVDAATMLRDTYIQASKIESFRGSYQGVVESPAGKIQFRLVVAYVRPDKLRLEVLFSGLNRMASMLTVSGGRMSLLDAAGHRYYSGPLSREAIANLTGVPLSAAELMLWFAGRYRPESAGQIGSFKVFSGAQPVAVFALTGGRGVVIRQCRGKTGILDAYELRIGEDNAEALLTRYDCVSAAGGPNLPGTIRFWLPQDGAAGVLTLESGKLNPNLSAAPKALFEPPAPGGLEQLPIDQASKGALFGR